MNSPVSSISIFGLGYVGAVSSACFAKLGFGVIGVDIDAGKVEALAAGRAPVLEKDLDRLLAEQHAAGRIRATSDVGDAVANSDISIVCVGTPSGSNGSLDTSHVERVCRQIGEALGRKLHAVDPPQPPLVEGGSTNTVRTVATERYHVVCIRSTVLPGTVESMLVPILETASGKKAGADFGVAQNPEFLREGTAIEDFFNPPKTVIGAIDERAARCVGALYEQIKAPLFSTSIGVASAVKYADNAFHAAKITFANEIGRFCRRHGIDSQEVLRIFREDTKLNISPAYLRPGFAFGGSCLPKDLRALLHAARTADLSLPFLGAMLGSNREQIDALVTELLPYRRDGIGLLGLSFKAGTDDLRESPMVSVVELLLGKGASVRIHDPSLKLSALVGANLRYIMTEIPHIATLLEESIERVIRSARAVVVSHNTPAFREAVGQMRPDQVVFDLVGLPEHRKITAQYRGVCW